LVERKESTLTVSINGVARDIATPVSLNQLLTQLQLESQHVAIEVNLQLIPRSQHDEFQVNEGDQVEIVTLAGGG
jgi:thiamine biosynthesis protein ThiS